MTELIKIYTNTYWARSLKPLDPSTYPDHIYLAGPDTNGDGIGDGIGAYRLGVGTQNPGDKVQVDAINPTWIGAGAAPIDGNVYLSGLVTSAGGPVNAEYMHTSDERLKTNLKTLSGLEIIDQLEPVRFNWKSNGRASLGLIAQKVEEVLPQIVHEQKVTGLKTMSYDLLVAPLIEANKQMERNLHSAEQQLQNLEAQYDLLKVELQKRQQ